FGLASHESWYRCLQIADSWAWLPMNASLLGAISRTFTENPYFLEAATWSPRQVQLAFVGLAAVIGLATLIRAAGDRGPGVEDRSFALLLVTAILICPLGWSYYFWLPLGPVLAVMQQWHRSNPPLSCQARWGRFIFWVGFGGLFWPIQLNTIGQYS